MAELNAREQVVNLRAAARCGVTFAAGDAATHGGAGERALGK